MPSKSGCKTTCSNSNMIRLSCFVAVPAHLKRNVLPVPLNIVDKSISPPDRVRNLGVIFDSQISVSGYVTFLCSSLTYQLRNISRIRRCLDYYTCHLVTRALVLSGIDYGNGLLLSANKSDIQKLQRIQNWAAKLMCKSHKWDHTTTVSAGTPFVDCGEKNNLQGSYDCF